MSQPRPAIDPSRKAPYRVVCVNCAEYLKAVGLQPSRAQVDRWLGGTQKCDRCRRLHFTTERS